MLLKRKTFVLFFVACSLILWCKSASAGSSFLSHSQKPQHKGKSHRVGRQVESGQPTEDNHMTISAPFEIGITVGEEDFDKYSMVLQEIIQRLLGNTDTTERASQV
ncbi:ghrelin/obestatin prepropeptide [Anabas testudineus]|uniref:Motilin/ghrelin-associated peptide domain-containing protein n=1 Tax=Anabas testudineus TaxID=64144 RepID=A0A3Q1H7K3_ANATE|nr:ghrelin/obestatin prepropeptide [Anabas testudineus]